MNNINVNDTVYFMFKDKIQSAQVVRKTTVETAHTGMYAGGFPEVRVTIDIDNNPCGSQYTKTFDVKDVFFKKEDLIKSLVEGSAL